ncbi:MAG: sulfite exporter TauE/SafE family protein [Flavobacteriales bacterium]|nr:sulfite exporter TauE/SafE family protein [Flavobacteriales bacterium]
MFLPVAFSLGFLGSFHCMGMCGPIALALPLNRKNYLTMVIGSAAYNFGRVFTYSAIGLVFGLIGQGLFIAGYQNFLSLTLGILILLSLIFSAWANRLGNNAVIFRIVNGLKSKFIPLFNKKSTGGLFLIGMLNGLLPCGFVYMGITGSIATGSAIYGALFMAFFGLGTLPAMMAMNMVGGIVSVNFRNNVRRMVPVVVGIMGLALVLRGLNLGIPYLSPSIVEKKIEVVDNDGNKKTETMAVPDCCKKPDHRIRNKEKQ